MSAIFYFYFFPQTAKDTAGLPRPRLEDIPSSDGDDKSSSGKTVFFNESLWMVFHNMYWYGH